MTPEILYEDNHIIVAVKPAGVLSQSDGSEAPDMLTLLKEYLRIKYAKPGNVFLGLIHRLDRPVEGVMVFAKTGKAASRLSEQIRSRSVTKKYRAVIAGIPDTEDGKTPQGTVPVRLSGYIVKDGKTNTVKVFDKAVSGGKEAYLDYVVTGVGKSGLSLVDIELGTGRSHQIRAMFAHIGHPLLGDRKYGTGVPAPKYRGDICLQSYRIGFKHPVKGEYMEFSLPLKKEWPWSEFEKG